MKVADDHITRWENTYWTDGQRFFILYTHREKKCDEIIQMQHSDVVMCVKRPVLVIMTT